VIAQKGRELEIASQHKSQFVVEEAGILERGRLT
jgi:hypothetical protein